MLDPASTCRAPAAASSREAVPTPAPLSPEDEAARFAQSIHPLPDAPSGWVFDYALRAYDDAARSVDFLDLKADKFVGYVSASFAAFIAISGVGAKAFPAIAGLLGWTAIPSAALWIAALLTALYAQRPREQALPPSIKSAIELAQHYDGYPEEKVAKVAFAAQIHPARVAQQQVARDKAHLLRRAFWLYAFAVMGLALPMLTLLLLKGG